jgi:hypothetical protein
MSRILLLFAAMICTLNSIAQNHLPGIYTGGSNDGLTSATATSQNPLPGIYKGANNDGFSLALSVSQNSLPVIYTGGNNDGFHLAIATSQNVLPVIYTGGSNDGFSGITLLTQNVLPNIYPGGANDGFDMKLFAGQNLLPGIYRGGSDDGYSSAFTSKFVYRFTGNGNWNNAVNWENDLIPPTPLPAGSEIIIDPSGTCILNVVQVLAAGSKLTVLTGKTMTVPAIQ